MSVKRFTVEPLTDPMYRDASRKLGGLMDLPQRCAWTLLALPLLSSCLALDAITVPAGKVQGVAAIQADGEEIHLILQKFQSRVYLMSREGVDEHSDQYYVSSLPMHATEAALSPARRLFEDGSKQDSEFVKVAGTDNYLAIVDDGGGREISLLRPNQNGRYASRLVLRVPDKSDYAVPPHIHRDGLAITRSGHHFLLVTDKELLIRDVVSGTDVERTPNHPLVDHRADFYRRFGSGGRWWLTDDLRFIVVLSPQMLYWRGVEASIRSTAVERFGLSLDLSIHGLIYDRQTGNFSICSEQLIMSDMPDSRLRFLDAESDKGELLLLYRTGGDSYFAIIDQAGKVRHRTAHSIYASWFCWVPSAGVLHVVRAGNSEDVNPSRPFSIDSINYLTGSESSHILTQEHVRQRIAEAR